MRFHARAGHEGALEKAFRSNREPRLFYIHSRWKDEAAFDHHGGLPHTKRFVGPSSR